MTIIESEEKEKAKVGKKCETHGLMIREGKYSWAYCPGRDELNRSCTGIIKEEK